MRKFLFRIGVSLTMAITIYGLTAVFFANGRIDPFYLLFTTPAQHSLILGNSRAAQGIVPSIVGASLEPLDFQGEPFNYSFTLSTSPYGP